MVRRAFSRRKNSDRLSRHRQLGTARLRWRSPALQWTGAAVAGSAARPTSRGRWPSNSEFLSTLRRRITPKRIARVGGSRIKATPVPGAASRSCSGKSPVRGGEPATTATKPNSESRTTGVLLHRNEAATAVRSDPSKAPVAPSRAFRERSDRDPEVETWGYRLSSLRDYLHTGVTVGRGVSRLPRIADRPVVTAL